MKAIASVFGTALISQIPSFLNALFQPFKGTWFVFDGWESSASKTAVPIGLVIILVIAAWAHSTAAPPAVLLKWARRSLIATIVLFALCLGMHFFIDWGYAPTVQFLHVTRDVIWWILYLVTLVMVGITVALAQLALFPFGSGAGAGGR